MPGFESKITITAVDKVSSVVKDITKTMDKLKVTTGDIGKSWNRFADAGGEVITKIRNLSLVAIGAGAAIFGLANHYSEMSDELLRTSQSTGVTVDNLQKLQYVAKLGNLPIDNLNLSLKALNKSIVDAAKNPASEAAAAFNSMGVKVRDLSGNLRDANSVLLDMSDVFARNADGANKVSTATTILGARTGQLLIPIMNKGSEAIKRQQQEFIKIGNLMTTEVLEKNAKFQDEYQKLKTAIGGVVSVLATELIPVVQPVVVAMKEWIVANKTLIADKTKQYVHDFAAGLKNVWLHLYDIIGRTYNIIQALGGFKAIIAIVAGIYIGRFVLSLLNLAGAFVGLLGTLASFSLAILATPLGWMLLGLVALAAGVYLLYTRWDQIKAIMPQVQAAMSNIWVSVKPQFETFMDGITGGTYSAIKNIITAWDGIKPTLIAIWESIKASAEPIWLGIKKGAEIAWTGLGPIIVTAWTGIKEQWIPILTGILAIFDTTWDQVADRLHEKLERMKKDFADFFDPANGPLSDAAKFIGGKAFDFMHPGRVKEATASTTSKAPEKKKSLLASLPGADLATKAMGISKIALDKFNAAAAALATPVQVPTPISNILNATDTTKAQPQQSNIAKPFYSSLYGNGQQQTSKVDINMTVNTQGQVQTDKVKVTGDNLSNFALDTGRIV